MSQQEYLNSYLKRAEFFPATGRTLEGLHGLMLRKEVNINVPDNLKMYLDNVDGEGNDIHQFINDSTWETMITCFGGILVDVPESDENTSIRAAEEMGIAPYMTYYDAFKIINWHWERKGRTKILKYVVLKELSEVLTDSGDPFTKELKEQYRVLELDSEGYYKQTLYGDNQNVLQETYPKRLGQRMRYIPFYFIPNTKPYTPMMLNLSMVNIAWYRKSADYENGLHWTGVPTPYSIGYVPETKQIEDADGNIVEVPVRDMKLGGSQFLYFPDGTTHVGYLEFSGAGLGQLATAMERDEERMAILGARIISQEKKGVESAETAKIHRAGENSVLASFALEMSKSITHAVKDYLEWSVGYEIQDEIDITLNTDYDVSNMSPSELTALVSLWQSGGISKRILFENLKDGEVVDGSESFEDMENEITLEREQATIQAAMLNQQIEQ